MSVKEEDSTLESWKAERGEYLMLPKDNMTRDLEPLGDRIPTPIPSMFNTISKEATQPSSRL